MPRPGANAGLHAHRSTEQSFLPRCNREYLNRIVRKVADQHEVVAGRDGGAVQMRNLLPVFHWAEHAARWIVLAVKPACICNLTRRTQGVRGHASASVVRHKGAPACAVYRDITGASATRAYLLDLFQGSLCGVDAKARQGAVPFGCFIASIEQGEFWVHRQEGRAIGRDGQFNRAQLSGGCVPWSAIDSLDTGSKEDPAGLGGGLRKASQGEGQSSGGGKELAARRKYLCHTGSASVRNFANGCREVVRSPL